MSKSKFQSEKDKQQSILNCIGSITGNLSEAVISGFNPSVSNNRNSQQSPSFNPTASSPTFNQTASSPTFNQPAAPVPAAPTINQNPSSTQDVWNRLLLPKKQQPVAAATSAPDAQETETDVESMDVSQDPKLKAMFDRLGSTPNTQPNIETDKNRGLGSSPNVNAVSKSINNKNKTKQTFNKYFKVPAQPNTNTAPLGDLSVNKKQRDTIGNNLLGNPVVNGVQMDSPFNNSLKVPFTPDFSGDAPPNINLSSDVRPGSPADTAANIINKQNTIGTPNMTGAPVRLNDPYSQEIVTTEMDKANQTSAVPATASLGYGASVRTPNASSPVNPTQKTKDDFNKYFKKPQPAAPATASLGYGASVRTPPAASTSKNSQTPMRGDEDQGTSETNQMITPNYPDQAQHQDMFAGSGRPADTDRRPGGAEDVAAGIVNKQDTIGTPDTTGTTVFTSKTGDFVAKPQNNNAQTNPGFMTSPQGAPNAPSTSVPKPKTSLPSAKVKEDPIVTANRKANTGVPNQNGNDQFGNTPAAIEQSNKDFAAWELANPNNPAVLAKKQAQIRNIDRDNSQLASDRQRGIPNSGQYRGTPGVGSLEDSRRGRVGLDAVGAQPDNSPEAIKQRGEEGRSNLIKNGWSFDDQGRAVNPTQTKAIEADRELTRISQLDRSTDDAGPNKNPPKPITTNLDKYTAEREAKTKEFKAGETTRDVTKDGIKTTILGRKEKAAQREIDYQENNLLKLQRRADLTNARNALEDAQNRKTSSGRNMSSASRGSGGGGAGQSTATNNKTAFNATADQMSKEVSNNKQAEWDKKYGQGSGQAPLEAASTRSTKTMKGGTLIAELFDGDFLSNLKAAGTAVGTLATPPEELLYTTGGVMGRAGYTRQGASKRTKHYQNILNSIADLGVNGLANTVGQVAPKTTAGVVNNTVYPATKVAANMLTRMLYDPRSDEDADDVTLSFKDEKKKEEPADASETAPDATPAKKSRTKKSGTSISPDGNPTGINPDTGNTWVKSDTNPVFGLANKIKPKTQQIQWNPYKADFSQQQYRAAAE